jgi:hypothetical protein
MLRSTASVVLETEPSQPTEVNLGWVRFSENPAFRVETRGAFCRCSRVEFSREFFPDKLAGLPRLSKKRRTREDSRTMLRAIVAVLLILWLLGFVLHIAGGVIHLLAVIAVVVLIYDLVARKKPVS